MGAFDLQLQTSKMSNDFLEIQLRNCERTTILPHVPFVPLGGLYKNTWSTSNLNRHLKNKHRIEKNV